MPQPAEVQAASQQLEDVFQRAWDEIVQEQQRILLEPSQQRRRARLRELRGSVEQMMGDVNDEARDWINTRLTETYARGGIAGEVTEPFGWTQAHMDAIQVIATDMYDDVLTATKFVTHDTKRFIREVGRERLGVGLAAGRNPTEVGRQLTKLMDQHGISAVVYKDGQKHGLAEYGQMLTQTKSAMAYNTGTLNQAAHDDVKFWEILDGPGCGLTFHQDTTIANGMIVDKRTAETYPIAHPRCRRTFAPRPDVKTKKQARDADRVRTEAQVEDVRNADRQRQRRSSRRARTTTRLPDVTDDRMTWQLMSEFPMPSREWRELSESMKDALSAEERDALNRYIGNSKGINGALRGGEVPDFVSQLDSIASRTTFDLDTPLYRGIDPRAVTELVPGSVFTDLGFQSTSVTPMVASGFGSHVLVIDNARGAGGIWGSNLEQEFILARGTSLRIVSRTITSDGSVVHAIIE